MIYTSGKSWRPELRLLSAMSTTNGNGNITAATAQPPNTNGGVATNSASNTATTTTTHDNAADGDQLLLATGGYDHTIKIWQAHTGNCNRTMQHNDSVKHIV